MLKQNNINRSRCVNNGADILNVYQQEESSKMSAPLLTQHNLFRLFFLRIHYGHSSCRFSGANDSKVNSQPFSSADQVEMLLVFRISVLKLHETAENPGFKPLSWSSPSNATLKNVFLHCFESQPLRQGFICKIVCTSSKRPKKKLFTRTGF